MLISVLRDQSSLDHIIALGIPNKLVISKNWHLVDFSSYLVLDFSSYFMISVITHPLYAHPCALQCSARLLVNVPLIFYKCILAVCQLTDKVNVFYQP